MIYLVLVVPFYPSPGVTARLCRVSSRRTICAGAFLLPEGAHVHPQLPLRHGLLEQRHPLREPQHNAGGNRDGLHAERPGRTGGRLGSK